MHSLLIAVIQSPSPNYQLEVMLPLRVETNLHVFQCGRLHAHARDVGALA